MKAGASCVWASCCGLLNDLMGTGAVRGQQAAFGGGAGHFRFAPAAGYSTFSTTSTLLCQACGQAFSVFRRRHVCCDCKKTFCSLCCVLQENLRRCATCHLLRETAFQRSRLMRLRVKDLRLYLMLHDISTDTCREKEDLVDLVLCHQGAESGEEPDTPTSPSHPLHRAPTADPASPLSLFHREPVNSSDNSGFTNQGVGDSTPLFNLEPAERPQQGMRTSHAPRASLSDLSSLEDVEQLTVRQLKEILVRNFVSFSGCCEKWELVERVRRLYHENNGTRKSNGETRLSSDDSLCRICMDAVIDCVLLECGHMVTCTKCGKRMNECPICRQYVIRAVHVFRS
ncbi:E3 ubiquitin-protein ligase RNF34a isoform X1 [Electrophorus electricus]|uniref:E3 ubiquitin-protein ligase RNF34a isoform X1 n=2 Tax=Electrophorus electricus TaxID=8005 RepID=UPI0015D080F6|nr:E3 ubiquitin-protein ligase RNF34a isoform X1 [Electrophorus electricus]